MEILSLRQWDNWLQNAVTLKTGLGVRQDHWRCHHSIDGYGFILVFYNNFVPKMNRFWDIRLLKMSWPWNRGQRSLKVIGTDTDRSAIYDFLLTFHSNYGYISHHFRGRRRYKKIAKFSHLRVFGEPLTGFPLELSIGATGQKTRIMGLPVGRKSFKIGLAV